jgi:hypothetical protein
MVIAIMYSLRVKNCSLLLFLEFRYQFQFFVPELKSSPSEFTIFDNGSLSKIKIAFVRSIVSPQHSVHTKVTLQTSGKNTKVEQNLKAEANSPQNSLFDLKSRAVYCQKFYTNGLRVIISIGLLPCTDRF